MPISRSVRMMRTAISPRFAIRTLGFATILAVGRGPPAGNRTCEAPDGDPDVLLTASDLEGALTEAGLHAPVRADEVTASTNDAPRAWAETGAAEWSLVAAGHQTDGRGRQGRTWEDRPGRAVLVSVVLR